MSYNHKFGHSTLKIISCVRWIFTGIIFGNKHLSSKFYFILIKPLILFCQDLDELLGTKIFSCTFCGSLGHGDVNYLAGFHCITLKMFFVYNQ